MPFLAALPQILIHLGRSWPAIISISGLILVTGFSFNQAMAEATKSINELWWIAALACVVILVREYIKCYFAVKKKQAQMGG